RVGNDDPGVFRRRIDAARLFTCDADLLVLQWRSPILDAELAQHFGHERDLQPARRERGADPGGERRLAGAFGAQQGDDEGTAHRLAARAPRPARQPATDKTTNTA